MKLLLLLAFVASAYSAYFEPGECLVDICFLIDDTKFEVDQWTDLKNRIGTIVGKSKLHEGAWQIAIEKFGNSIEIFSVNLTQFNNDRWALFWEISENMLKNKQDSGDEITLAHAYNRCWNQGDRELADNFAVVIRHGWTSAQLDDVQSLMDQGARIISVGMLDLDSASPDYIFEDDFEKFPKQMKNEIGNICAEQVRTCKGHYGGTLQTFDDAMMEIAEEQKTLIAEWGKGTSDVCKFRVRAVSNKDCIYDSELTNYIFYDWIGFSFDASLRNPENYRWNYLLTNMPDPIVRKRGENVPKGSYITEFPYKETLSDGVTQIKITKSIIRKGKKKGNIKFTIRSDCNYGINWEPSFRLSLLEVLVRARNVTGEVKGVCGNSDGDAANDWMDCQGNMIAESEDGARQIGASCKDGPNQGQKIPGCSKK